MYGLSSGILFISSVVMVHYTTLSVYRIPYFVSTNLLVLTVPLTLLVLVTKVTGSRDGLPPGASAAHPGGGGEGEQLPAGAGDNMAELPFEDEGDEEDKKSK